MPEHVSGDADTTTAIGGLVIVLAVIFVGLRFYTRWFTKVGYGWDDWFILLSVVSAVVTGVLVIWATAVDPDGEWVTSNSDPSYHYTDANIFHLKLSFVASILYFTITSTAKLSILLMYSRIFSVSTSFRRQIAVVCVVVVGFWIGCTLATLTNCIPLKWSWLNSLSDAKYCFNYNIFWMATGVCEAVIDSVIILLPIRMVLRLRLSKEKKFTVAMVFLIGTFVIVTGIVKVILGYVPGSRVPSYIRTEVWTTVHAGMGIVCACLPVCWPLFKRISRSKFVSKIKSYAPSSKSSKSPNSSAHSGYQNIQGPRGRAGNDNLVAGKKGAIVTSTVSRVPVNSQYPNAGAMESGMRYDDDYMPEEIPLRDVEDNSARPRPMN